MEKVKADRLIAEYLQKIYGFAFKKAFSYDEAEELASEMTLEVYRSLLARDDVYNCDGYIWRICEHTYAKYVSSVKRKSGIAFDGTDDLIYYEDFSIDGDAVDEERQRLRREIAFLSAQRREIIFCFYYKSEPIRSIASRLHISEGTVKWHLNKARNELKEGLKMERRIGSLGLNPVMKNSFGHSGSVGATGGPEYYLGDKLNLNIVYSVYFEPRNITEISQELGVTPVFIEDRITFLEENGYLVKTKGDRYITYVNFTPQTYSRERLYLALKKKLDAASTIVREYVPLVRASVADVRDIYIPGGNRELFEAAAVLYAVVNKCRTGKGISAKELDKYYISDLSGGRYIAYAYLNSECIDPEYKMTVVDNYGACGNMWRESEKYPAVRSWSIDSRLDSRSGTWQNNLTTDYESLYEYMTGRLGDTVVNAEKLNRLKERGFIDGEGRENIMVYRGTENELFRSIPELGDDLKEAFAADGLELAMQNAKQYPPHMSDLIISSVGELVDNTVAVMVLDILYSDGTFKPLTEAERTAANLIMFSDTLPE